MSQFKYMYYLTYPPGIFNTYYVSYSSEPDWNMQRSAGAFYVSAETIYSLSKIRKIIEKHIYVYMTKLPIKLIHIESLEKFIESARILEEDGTAYIRLWLDNSNKQKCL